MLTTEKEKEGLNALLFLALRKKKEDRGSFSSANISAGIINIFMGLSFSFLARILSA